MDLTKDAKKFKQRVKIQMELMGATDAELRLLTNEAVMNAIKQGRSPKDVAWAILQ